MINSKKSSLFDCFITNQMLPICVYLYLLAYWSSSHVLALGCAFWAEAASGAPGLCGAGSVPSRFSTTSVLWLTRVRSMVIARFESQLFSDGINEKALWLGIYRPGWRDFSQSSSISFCPFQGRTNSSRCLRCSLSQLLLQRYRAQLQLSGHQGASPWGAAGRGLAIYCWPLEGAFSALY